MKPFERLRPYMPYEGMSQSTKAWQKISLFGRAVEYAGVGVAVIPTVIEAIQADPAFVDTFVAGGVMALVGRGIVYAADHIFPQHHQRDNA